MSWNDTTNNLSSKQFVCGHCESFVGSATGYYFSVRTGNGSILKYIYICPHCKEPTYFNKDNLQIPGAAPGHDVGHVPDKVHHLYNEARNCIAASCYTSSVLACRKLLMNIAVDQGADEGKSFVYYVQFLAEKGFVPPNGRGWVDHIRTKGNEANHEISLMTQQDAEELVLFSEMLLKFIYEFPSKVPQPSA